MMKLTKVIVPAAILSVCLAFHSACSNSAKHEDSKEQAEEINEEKFDNKGEKDADRLVEVYSDNLYEIKTSENAAMKASTTDVKKLAGMMVVAHNKMKSDMEALAMKKNITLPTDITDEQRRKMDDLTKKDGLDYDKEYTEQLKNRHENAENVLQKLADHAEDAEIKQWASSSVPEIRSHLEMVNATLNTVKDEKHDDRERKKDKNTWEGKSGINDGRANTKDHNDKNH